MPLLLQRLFMPMHKKSVSAELFSVPLYLIPWSIHRQGYGYETSRKSVQPIGLKDITIVDDAKMKRRSPPPRWAMPWNGSTLASTARRLCPGQDVLPRGRPQRADDRGAGDLLGAVPDPPLGGLFFGAWATSSGGRKCSPRPS
jgi:hypothetical protein